MGTRVYLLNSTKPRAADHYEGYCVFYEVLRDPRVPVWSKDGAGNDFTAEADEQRFHFRPLFPPPLEFP